MVSYDLSEKIIPVHVGEQVEIAVPSGGANGYAWSVKSDSSVIEVIEHRRQPDMRSFGGRGKECFVVKLNERGRAELEFTLKAPWQSEAAERRQLVLDGNE